jgi:adenylate cyclase
VVLPFANLSGDMPDDHIADAITEDLTADLSRLPGALVVAIHSAATYRGKRIDIRASASSGRRHSKSGIRITGREGR